MTLYSEREHRYQKQCVSRNGNPSNHREWNTVALPKDTIAVVTKRSSESQVLRPSIILALVVAALVLIWQPALAATINLEAAVREYKKQEYAVALKLFTPPANAGNASAQYHIGMLYRFGWGIDKNFMIARQWFEKSATQSHAESQAELGKIYKDGRGVERDAKKAAEWFLRAAENDLGVAQLNLGRMYRTGKGLPRDSKAAYMWFSLAITNRYMDAIGHRARLMKKMSKEDIEAAKAMTAAQRQKMSKKLE